MMTNTETITKGIQTLAQYLGDLRGRFIALIQREPFDYTQWQKDIDADDSIEEISRKAMALRNNLRLDAK